MTIGKRELGKLALAENTQAAVSGVSSFGLDMDRYNGSLADLRAWCGLQPSELNPPITTPTVEQRLDALEAWRKTFAQS